MCKNNNPIMVDFIIKTINNLDNYLDELMTNDDNRIADIILYYVKKYPSYIDFYILARNPNHKISNYLLNNLQNHDISSYSFSMNTNNDVVRFLIKNPQYINISGFCQNNNKMAIKFCLDKFNKNIDIDPFYMVSSNNDDRIVDLILSKKSLIKFIYI